MFAEKTLTKVSRDYRKFARNMAILKNSMDRASDIYNARLEGKTEGEAIGRAAGTAEASLEIARKMKALGDSPEKIQAVTGLSPETIEGL
jgi:predicted transposase/invertase (TIGR01784 family)